MSPHPRMQLPSPIPTARGIRSAANDKLSEYLQKSTHIPDLILPPQSQFPASKRHPAPSVIDFPSLLSNADDSVKRLLRSARDFGVFLVSRHGISGHTLKSFVEECELVFRISGEDRIEFRQRGAQDSVWICCQEERMEWVSERIGTETYRHFCQKVEKVANDFNGIAEQVGLVLLEQVGNTDRERKHTVLSLHRYEDLMVQNQSAESLKAHALSFHLPFRGCQFAVQTSRGSFSFDAGPETIVVSIGQELEARSRSEFQSVLRELVFEPDLHGGHVFFSMKLKSSLPCSTNRRSLSSSETCITKNNHGTITIFDQIFYTMMIVLLYKIFLPMISKSL